MEGFPALFRICTPDECPIPIKDHVFVFIDPSDSNRFKCKDHDNVVEYLLTSGGEFISCANPIT